ncbi:MAG: YhcH/YjgK/YiaL family protein [Succinivibrio sp.]|nr:YhcH/YjgK/YiaL family protein [Succinivibrio sp.]
MLATSLDIAEKYDYLDPKFKAAFKWLRDNDVPSMKDGRYEITDGVFALVQRYETLPLEKARFEAHKDFFDIQYLAAGHETFGVALLKDGKLAESVPQNDCYFYDKPDFWTPVNLKAGDFCIVPPEEIHMPRAAYNGKSESVVKVVVKVKV